MCVSVFQFCMLAGSQGQSFISGLSFHTRQLFIPPLTFLSRRKFLTDDRRKGHGVCMKEERELKMVEGNARVTRERRLDRNNKG